LKASAIPDAILKEFTLVNEGKSNHKINSFKEIAWIDPFPNAATIAPVHKPKVEKKEKKKKEKHKKDDFQPE
jgi:hypothetical protein